MNKVIKYIIPIILFSILSLVSLISIYKSSIDKSEELLIIIRDTQLLYLSDSSLETKYLKESDRIYKKSLSLSNDLERIKYTSLISQIFTMPYKSIKIDSEVEKLASKSRKLGETIRYKEALKIRNSTSK
ncbi:hypothetical protein AGE29_01135 (plasmid) [Clostridium botulinum]|uniref:Uncharacterized protein n=1 Tax=Clostridium botulinum (strain 657 / Type Ba4) TaxID=515621 RepID=A0A3F2ZPU1_CLOB6|nr:hypothetical protein [Clostridium botulinum]ACQ51264.1 hypothetical protein CLJ_0178 [Clostridium botulinum Ba4 str. 657]AXG90445.1 hypothetical protein AGE29_01135 [Clostridium botulinum]RFM21153.1 hypothetical protein C1146_12700 [Clostridium botulinum]BDB03807.1 hypothetical protein CBOS2020_38810 [Clostridium botulinum]